MTEIGNTPPEPIEKPNPEVLTDREFDTQAKRDMLSSANNPNHIRWRKDADDDNEFVAGGAYDDSGQWLADDIAVLKAQKRPIITLNRLEPLVEGIVGAEVNNRQQISFQARETADKPVAMALQEAGKWARDNDVEEEETDAFRQTIICGMGWVHHRMNYTEDLDGKYEVLSTDPLAHYWDVDSIRPNLADARWVGYVEQMSRDRFKVLFPGEKGKSDIFGVKPFPLGDSTRAEKEPSDYDDPNLTDTGVVQDGQKRNIVVLEYQCYKLEPAYRVLDVATEELSDPMDREEFNKLREAVEAQGAVMARFGTPVDPDENGVAPVVFRFLKQPKKTYYRAFYSGNRRLEPRERNPWRNGFTMQCITGRRHQKRNTWYGVVRAMKDPQRLTNSFMSSMIHHYNSNPKGGVFFEEGAMDNPEEMEAKLAHPSPSIELLPGGLAKIEMIQPANASQALDRLLTFMMDMPPLVTGISLEFIGLAGRDQAIGLEQTRKLSTLSIVSPIFSSYRRYKKQAGRLLYDFIVDFIPAATLTRILSAESKPLVPQIKAPNTLKFDIHVDDAPLSPSVKATVFSVMKDMLQFLPPELAPSFLPDFLDFSPLPTALVQKLQKALQPRPPNPMAQLAKILELRKVAAEIHEKESKAGLNEAKTDTETDKSDLEQDKLDLAQFDSIINLLQTQIQMQVKNSGEAK